MTFSATAWNAAQAANNALHGKTMLGEKLRRAMVRGVDTWNIKPLIDTPAYANNAPLIVGEAIKANANIYVVIVGGTTAASGTGPSFTQGSAADGTVTFAYYSPAYADYTDSEAPTVTLTTTNPSGTLPNIYSPESVGAASSYVQNCMTPIGGYITYDGSNRNQLITFDRHTNGATDNVGKYTSWAFETDAPTIAIRFSTISIIRTVGIRIDGKLLRLGGYALPAGGQAWIKLDFPVGVRKVRRITVDHGQGGDVRMRDVYVTGRDFVRRVTKEKVRAAFISDSIFDGSAYGPMLPGASAPQRIAAAMGWDDPWSFSQGSTGYNNPGTGPYYTYEQRVAEAATRSPDVWVLFGSTNDGSYTSGQRQAAALSCLRVIRAVSSSPIFMMGVFSVNTGAPTIEADMLAAFNTFADRASYFVPIASPTDDRPWITGSWNNSAFTNASNASYTINITDNIHPYDAGTAVLARRAVNEFQRILDSAL